MDSKLTAERWDAEYERGRYGHEPPLPFVREIVAALRDQGDSAHGPGLYVGCGNGRNYVPLVEAGLLRGASATPGSPAHDIALADLWRLPQVP